MSNNDHNQLTVDTVDKYFYELSKELKKEYGRGKEFEIVVVGGAAIMFNYDFRGTTTDVDGYVSMGGSVKDAANRVAEKYGISTDWLNSDFKRTNSYSARLTQFSKFYKNYNQILSVRTINAEYLIAMKLVSFRAYKRDRSDILGILETHKKMNKPISYEQINKAVVDLYGGWDRIEDSAQEFIRKVTQDTVYNYALEVDLENENKTLLIDFEKRYQDVLTEENLDTVLAMLQSKKNVNSPVLKPRGPKL